MLLHYYHNIFKYTKWDHLPFFVIARILLVDSESFPSDPDMVDCLTEAISNFFSVACNLGGPSRMSLFGIMTFSSYPEVIIKKKCRYLAMRYKIILICWYLYIIIFFLRKWAIEQLYFALLRLRLITVASPEGQIYDQ